jgi:hypothetical protein
MRFALLVYTFGDGRETSKQFPHEKKKRPDCLHISLDRITFIFLRKENYKAVGSSRWRTPHPEQGKRGRW